MKSKILVLTAMVSFGLAFQSCEKEEPNLSSNKVLSQHKKNVEPVLKKDSKSKSNYHDPLDLVNPNNPFDSYGLSSSIIYEELEIIFEDDGLTQQELEYNLESLTEIYSDSIYPPVDTSSYSIEEASIISDYVDNTNMENLISSSIAVESTIIESEDFNSEQKSRLLSIISQYKFNYLYSYMLYSSTANKANFQGCMRAQAHNIFGDDNPVDDALFILGIPESFLGIAAYCVWESIF
jgi:hypothetical protein